MLRSVITLGLILGSIVSAWLRFDAGLVALSLMVLLICIIGAFAGWVFASKRVPHVALPPDVQELGSRDQLTSDEEAQFAGSLRTWHQRQQQEAWREITRQGPGPQIRLRAAVYYLWLCLFALTVVPPKAVPSVFESQLPRFAVVLLPLAFVALTFAVPLGIRDWKRARRSLDSGTDPQA
jgi:hypothetical protein